ncbi:MAG: response regulator [Desulfobacterium sp.]|nr:response regulator [Desulfobacterium sp.]
MAKKQLKIVIIDDNVDYLFTMGTFLKKNKFNVFTASDGETGLSLVKQEKPDIVLLDVMMETLFSGFEVCRQIRQDPLLKSIPIIGISGMADEINVGYDENRDFEYFDANIFMEKPVDKDLLLKNIKSLIKK